MTDDPYADLQAFDPTTLVAADTGDIADSDTPTPLLDVDWTGDLEADARIEQQQLTAEIVAYRERMARERQRLIDAISPDYYCVLVFASTAQLAAFLSGMGWDRYGGHPWLKGADIARHHDIALPPAPTWHPPKLDPDYAAMAMSVEDNKALD